MEKLSELLKKENHIWVHIKPRQRCKFLKFAKSNGFKWLNGNEISLKDECYFVMAMWDDFIIANVPAMARVLSKQRNTVYKIYFSDLAKGKYKGLYKC